MRVDSRGRFHLLQRFGIIQYIDSCSCGRLKACSSCELHANALLLDGLQMPMMDGLQATQRIREEEKQQGWARIPILGLTAHAISGYQETCLSHGMDAYLGKPFEINQLLKIIQKFI